MSSVGTFLKHTMPTLSTNFKVLEFKVLQTKGYRLECDTVWTFTVHRRTVLWLHLKDEKTRYRFITSWLERRKYESLPIHIPFFLSVPFTLYNKYQFALLFILFSEQVNIR